MKKLIFTPFLALAIGLYIIMKIIKGTIAWHLLFGLFNEKIKGSVCWKLIHIT